MTNTAKPVRPAHRRLEGVVTSVKMAKTAVVRVDRRIAHPKYGKTYTQSASFKVHDEHGKAKVGDVIEFEETRPISKDKHWRFIRTVKSA
jgi:small subunit ribosomal protein S17